MLAIISDIHDNLVNLDKVLKYCKEKNITTLACCGDVCNSETLEHLSKEFKNQIHLCLGNMELFDEDEPYEYGNIDFLGKEGGTFKYQNQLIGICHEPFRIDPLIKKNPELGIVFYGHTHTPWEEQRGKTRVINPGNVANVRYQPTFATYDPKNKEMKLHILDNMS